MAYVDTGVLIAAYAPKDPLRSAARNFLGKSRASRIISSLTFEELSSVLSRIEENLELPSILRQEPPQRRIRALVEYVVRDCRLTIASQVGSSRIRLGGRSVTMPMEYSTAAALAPKLKLRSLDLLHLAYASLISRLEFSISSFVTGDETILGKTDEIQESLNITVTHPDNAIRT
ncbi:MAG: hypothetical protein AUJ07_05160 [Crenarchaeota archaeon 13_1_40CM_3_53_5]|nr:MAG: hypothetical protein AUJ07_05160 [Crenarchaeota archaeon 13_1_40CM_3_53_5]